MKPSSLCFVIILSVGGLQSLSAQTEIPLSNPSFEDIPRAGGGNYTLKVPLEKPVHLPIEGWFDFRSIYFPMETPPDIHGFNTRFWNVTTHPYDGNSFLGLVTRPNGTYEGVSQQLAVPLEEGAMYQFAVYMCQDTGYTSPIRKPGAKESVMIKFNNPVVLRVSGSRNAGPDTILAQSTPVDHPEWREYRFDFVPQDNYQYLLIEAFYPDNKQEPTAGNLLIDSISLMKF